MQQYHELIDLENVIYQLMVISIIMILFGCCLFSSCCVMYFNGWIDLEERYADYERRDV